ncbi:MAG: diguanylate cyclase, partial [Deltaproteobacteria bacterium]
AEILAEKIRGTICSRAIEAARAVTVSLGVTEWRPDDTVGSLIERVDEALYVAKNTGRDRAVSL